MNTSVQQYETTGRRTGLVGAVLCAALVLTTVLFDPWMEDGFEIPKVIALRVGALAALWALLWSGRGRMGRMLKPRGLDVPVLAFLGACAVATAFSLHPYQSLFGQYKHYVWGLWSVMSLAIIYACFSRLPQDSASAWAWRSVLIAGTASLAYNLIQRLGLDPIPWGTDTQAQPFAFFGSAVKYGPFLGMLVPFCLSGLLKSPKGWSRLLWLGALAAVSLELMATLRRGAWLGALVSVAAWAFINRAALPKERKAAAAAGGLLLALVLALGAFGPSTLKARMDTFLSAKEGSASARLDLWRMSLRMMRDNKGLGSGLDTYGFLSLRYEIPGFRRMTGRSLVATNAHNEILQVGVTTGLLGLAAYLWMLLAFGARGLRILEESEGDRRLELSALYCAFWALWVHALFNFNTAGTLGSFWAFMGVFNAPRDIAGGDAPEPAARRGETLALVLAGACLAASVYSCAKQYLADKYFKTAYVSVQRQQWDRAIRLGEKALRLNPWGPDYALALAGAYRGKAQQESGELKAVLLRKASIVYREHSLLYRLDADAHHNYAMSLMWRALELGEPTVAEAIEEEQAAVGLAPLIADFWSALGQVYHYAGRVEDAKKAWVRAVDLEPGYREAAKWLEKYATKAQFQMEPQDLLVEDFPLGGEVDLASDRHKALKIANLDSRPLEFQLSLAPNYLAAYSAPEGFEPGPEEAVVRIPVQEIVLQPLDLRELSFRVAIPKSRRFAGKSYCFFVRVRCSSFDVPLDRVVRILIKTQEKGR